MSISVPSSSAAYATYGYSTSASETAQSARTSEQGAKSAAAQPPEDVVQISDEARQAAASIVPSSSSSMAADTADLGSPTEPVYTPVRTFTLPGGGTATLSTAHDVQGALTAQVSYVDNSGKQQTIPVNKSSTLRFSEDGTVEVIPAAEGETRKEPIGILKDVNGNPVQRDRTYHEVTGTDSDEVIILLPSNSKDGVWNVNAGHGDNTIIDLSGEEVHIRTGDGKDTIIGQGGTYWVESGGGDDVIDVEGAVVLVDGGDGNDSITAKGKEGRHGKYIGTIMGGTGNDSITVDGMVLGGVYGDHREASGSGGKDKISVSGAVLGGVVRGGDGGSSIYVEKAFNSIISGGSGHDTITVGKASGSVIDGGAGNDVIRADTLMNTTLQGGDGSNTISVGKAFDSNIYGNEKTPSKEKSSHSKGGEKERSEYEQSVIDAALGRNNNIKVDDALNSTISGGSGNDTITVGNALGSVIDGGQGDDSIKVDTLFGGQIEDSEGNDSITVKGSFNATISGGSGDDSITVGNSLGSHIDGGDGDDGINVETFVNSVLLGSGGNNQISVGSSYYSEIYSNDKPAPKEKESADKSIKKRELSEYEQSIIDAALGVEDESASDDVTSGAAETFADAAVPQEETSLPPLTDNTEEKPSTQPAENAPPRSRRGYHGDYGQSTWGHGRTSFSRAV